MKDTKNPYRQIGIIECDGGNIRNKFVRLSA